jgi:hypothetical protein
MLTPKEKKFWREQMAFVHKHTDRGRGVSDDYPGAAAHWYIMHFCQIRKELDRLHSALGKQDRELRRCKKENAEFKSALESIKERLSESCSCKSPCK